MRKTIPESVEINCDCCGSMFSKPDIVSDFTVELSGNGLDHAGHAVGNAYMSGKYDLCVSCYSSVTSLLRRELMK